MTKEQIKEIADKHCKNYLPENKLIGLVATPDQVVSAIEEALALEKEFLIQDKEKVERDLNKLAEQYENH